MFKRRNNSPRCTFINLAEQLAGDAGKVSSTMDSLLEKVVDDPAGRQRSDWSEIQRTVDAFETSESLTERTVIDSPAPHLRQARNRLGQAARNSQPN